MLPSEEIDRSMCLPNAIIDAMKLLDVAMTDKNRSSISGQRRRDIVFMLEESTPGGRFVDEFGDPRLHEIAMYEFERTQYIADQFGCTVAMATLLSLEEFLAYTSSEERVLAKVRVEGENHIEHVRWKSGEGGIVGNTRKFDRQTFEQDTQARAQSDGFNAIIFRRKTF